MRLYHWLLDTEAWLDLGPVPQSVYVRLARRYGGPGSNNGKIPCSLLELAQECRISKQTAMRALVALQDHGFIIRANPGAFNIKHRHATEWLLTEFKDDRHGKSLALPTRDFAHWRKADHGSSSKPHRVSRRNQSGFNKEQSQKETAGYGSTSQPAGDNHGSTSKPLLVYQGEYASEAVEIAPAGGVAPPNPKGGRVSDDGQAGDLVPIGEYLGTSEMLRRLRVGVSNSASEGLRVANRGSDTGKIGAASVAPPIPKVSGSRMP